MYSQKHLHSKLLINNMKLYIKHVISTLQQKYFISAQTNIQL